ncbi:MAG: T9SS type A sorting domain-containing protein [Bacteroidales bacterium]
MKTKNYKIMSLTGILIFLTTLVYGQLPVPGFYSNAQQKTRPLSMKQIAPDYRTGKSLIFNKSASASAKKNQEVSQHFLVKSLPGCLKPAASPNESVIGHTRYDKQTNGTMQNRIVLNDDGTLGATWTMGYTESNFPDRGTGYNFYDGTVWGVEPTDRIENTRTGWPSIAQWGPDGEIVVAHNGETGLEICKRPVRGNGAWTETLFQGPSGCPELSWPRVVTNGPDHQQVHLISLTTPVGNGGVLYNGQDGALVYSRSLNGGLTWDIHNIQMPGTGIENYVGLGGDTYAWAEPKGDTLALVVGDKWFDVFLLKSVDNGATWTKTMIWQHPFPFYEEDHTVITDTIWVCDGGMAVQLDNEGKANVFFGLMRVNNPDTTDEEFSYWYMTDGIAYWKEGDATFTCIEADSLYNQGHLVGWMQDLNGNDTIYEELSGIPAYTYSTTGMPTVTIDASGDMYLVMSSEMEGYNNGLQNYRHILVRKWDHNAMEWGDFFDVTESIIHNFHECIYPILASESDNYIHFLYMADEEPGLAVSGDEDPYGDNTMYYSKIAKSELVGLPENNTKASLNIQNYPNPCSAVTNIVVNNLISGELRILISDVNGRVMDCYDYGYVPAGNHIRTLGLSNYSPGVYFYTVSLGNYQQTGKVTVIEN